MIYRPVALAVILASLMAPAALAFDEDVDYGDSGWTYDGPQADADGVLVINGCRLEAKFDWSGADLTAANLEMVRANKLQLRGADLSSANLQEMKLYDSNLEDATFDDGTVITFAIFQDAYLEGCKGCPFDW